MTFREIIDDARVDCQAFGNFKSLTDSEMLRIVSEGMNKIQSGTNVVKVDVTFDTSDLAADGSVALDRSITVPTRCYFTPTGGSDASRQEVTFMPPDDVAKWKNNPNCFRSDGRIYATLEENKIWIYPFAGLSGTFTATAYAKLPLYAASRTTETGSYWYGWTASALKNKIDTTKIPQEFENAEIELTSYVAAKLLTMIPGWKKLYRDDYAERMAVFEAGFGKVKADQPQYPVNHRPSPNYGW